MDLKGFTLPLLLSAALTLSGCDSDEESSSVTLRILETTDIHANVMNYNYYQNTVDNSVGLVKTATLIEQARSEVKNSVLVDNGDLIQGSPLGDYFAKIKTLESHQVHPIYKAMNLLDYDVANIGNHEFNYGLDFLKEAINDANFPYISANVFYDDGDNDSSNDVPYFKPYLIQSKSVLDEDGNSHTLNIGYIGFVPPQIMQWDQSNLEQKVIAKDMVEMAQFYVPKMKAEGADIIIAIPHSGLTAAPRMGDDENASFYLSQVNGIDAIMFGHAHRHFPGDASYDNLEGIDNVNGKINGVPAVMPGYWGRYLGFIDLTLTRTDNEQWEISSSNTVLRPISEKNADKSISSLVDSHKAIVEAVATDHAAVTDWVNEPFAKITQPINSFFALVQDDPSVQVVTDAQKNYVEKHIRGTDLSEYPVLSVGSPFRAGRGGLDDYTNIPAGNMTYGNVSDLYIYANTLQALLLNGEQVKEWLEMSAGQFNQIQPGSQGAQLINSDFPSYNFDVIDGLEYQIDISQPARYDTKGKLINAESERIVALSFNGRPINLDQKFLVATNNYRGSGGGNFPYVVAENIVINAPDENRQIVANYLKDKTDASEGQTGFDPSADTNWRIRPLANTTVLFTSSNTDTAQSFAGQFENIQYVESNEEGYGVYKLDLNP